MHDGPNELLGAIAGAFWRRMPDLAAPSNPSRAVTVVRTDGLTRKAARPVPLMHRSIVPPVLPVGRGPFRRYLEARGAVGRIDRPHVTARLRASDGVALVGSYLAGPAGGEVAVLLAHGFAANRRKPAYARLAAALAVHASVLTLDMRGHGASGGGCTLGDREARDIEAAVSWLRGFGHDRVVAVGVSMGATAVLHAASSGLPVEGVVTVSAPGWFRDPPDTMPLQRLHAVWTSPVRRGALRFGLGVRLDGPAAWSSPPDPVMMIEHVTAPYLAVHGQDDPYFPASDAAALVRAAGGAAVGWLEPPGFGHAEDGFTSTFNQRLGAALTWWEVNGVFPGQAEVTPGG